MEKAAHPVFSGKETIARSVAPLVAVTASEEAEQLCRINHIPSVADLLKPFGDMMEGRVTPRDSQGVPNPIENFNIRFKHVDKLEEPNHAGIMRLVQEQVKERAEASNPDLPQ
ncbi:hypothetical protein K501DRAFT_280076, partial [Backusella circina FSU 941]